MQALRLFFGGEGSPTKADVQKKLGSLILSSLMEDLVLGFPFLVYVPKGERLISRSLGASEYMRGMCFGEKNEMLTKNHIVDGRNPCRTTEQTLE